MAKKVKIAFIGCGGVAAGHLAQGFKDFPDVDFIGWCDPIMENAEARRDQAGRGGEVFVDAEEMLEKIRPDGVYILIPPYSHGEPERIVLKHKLPFFIEKPVAIDMKTATMVAEGVKKGKLITSVGYMTRYRKGVARAKELLKKQKPVMLHGGWLGAGPSNLEGIWRWWVEKDKSGGQFLEQTTHTIDLARYLFGDVTHVYAVPVRDRRKRPDFYTIEDASMVQLTFANGAAGNLYSSCCTSQSGTNPGVSLSVWGTDMKVEFSGWQQSARIFLPDGEEINIPGEDNIFACEDRAFINSLKAGKNKGILATYEDGLKACAIACAANESMNTGKVVKVAV